MSHSLCEALLLYPDNNEYPQWRGRVALKLVPEVIDVDAQLLTPLLIKRLQLACALG
jgi:hypothetical protein